MIIIADKPGQMGNLLIIHAHFLAFAKECGQQVYNPSFYEYAPYFHQVKKQGGPLVFSLLYYLTRILVKLKVHNRFISARALDWDQYLDLDEPQASEIPSTFMFRQGWKYRCNRLLTKHGAYIRTVFSPNPVLKAKLDAFFAATFSVGETIIGIHIRRGDYINFESGKFYFDINEYVSLLQRIETLFSEIRIHFLICSNEAVDLQNFGAVKSPVSPALNHELLDMYSLARCHYIAGPPSTYTMWASFYGNVPLCMLHDIRKDMSLADFKIQATF